MRHKIIVITLGVVLLLSGCTGGGSNSQYMSESASNSSGFSIDSSSDSDYKTYDSISSTAGSDYSDDYEESEYDDSDESVVVENDNEQQESAKIDEVNPDEKLVYSGDIYIDTLEFDTCISQFREILSAYNGFIESEHITDNEDRYSYYYYEDREIHRDYVATIRVPSKNFKSLVNGVSGLGKIRSQDTNVENFTQEYKDIMISLDILQQSYNSYSKLLADATEVNQIITLTDKLTELQTQIEQAKSRLMHIDNDVAYSYLNVSIKEVTKYQEDPPKKDTFVERLVNTLKESCKGFLSFLEDLLFFIIIVAPYLALWGLIILVVVDIVRKVKKNRKLKGKSTKTEKSAQILSTNQKSNEEPDTTEPDRGSQCEHSDDSNTKN